MKISIVGAGIMGLSCAWALARLGHEVAVFEQGPIPNPLGSSHDAHRLIRFAYGGQVGYMRMVAEAYALWDLVWADLGETLYRATGTLVLSRGEQRWGRESAAALAADGQAVETLDPGMLERRFPLLLADPETRAFLHPGGGVLLADRILSALARHLGRLGVGLHSATPVGRVDFDLGHAILADGTRIDADLVVVAAGPWIARLVPGLAARVTPSRQVLAYLEPPAALAQAWAAMPMLLEIDEDSGFYAVPPVAGTGLKLGDHRFSRDGDPDRDRLADPAEAAALLALAGTRLRDGAHYRLANLKTCFYTVESQEKFIVEPVGRAGWIMSPCSGHGFKFGPLLGHAVACAIDGGEAGGIASWAAGEVG